MIDENIIFSYLDNKFENEFQIFCNKLFIKLYKDFQPVRAGGRNGDLGNDGYRTEARVFLACYAPKRYELEKTKSKIDSDIERVKSEWSDIKEWIFVTKEDLTADALRHIEDKNENMILKNYGRTKLLNLIQKLEDKEICDLINYPYQEILELYSERKRISKNKISFEVLNDIILHIEENEQDLDKIDIDDKEVIEIKDKISRNNLSEDFKNMISDEMKSIQQIKKFIESESIHQRRIKRFIKILKLEYINLKSNISISDEIFYQLVEKFTNNDSGEYKAGVVSVICYFFSICVIFEK